MPIAKFDDVEIFYEVHGNGEPLILVSGYMGDHTVWSGMLDTLAKQFKVVVFDNRAIGQTKDSGNSFTIETMADDVMKLSHQLELTHPHVVGQSMGGAIVQTLGMKYPKQIKNLVILNSVMKFSLVTHMAINTLLGLEKLNAPTDFIIDATLPWVFSSDFLGTPGNITALKEVLASNPYPQSTENKKRQLAAIDLFDSQKWVHKIEAEAMIIGSENDVLTPLAENRALANQISHAVFKTVPGGHASLVEQPEKLNKEILAFLTLRP